MHVGILTLLFLIFLGVLFATPLGDQIKALQHVFAAIVVLFLVLMFFTPVGWKI